MCGKVTGFNFTELCLTYLCQGEGDGWFHMCSCQSTVDLAVALLNNICTLFRVFPGVGNLPLLIVKEKHTNLEVRAAFASEQPCFNGVPN